MKRIIFKTAFITVAIAFALAMCFGVCAQDYNAKKDIDISDELEISGADRLFEGLDAKIKDELEKSGIDGVTPQAILNLDFKNVLSSVLSAFKEKILTPVKIFALIAGIVLLNAVFEAFKGTMEEKSGINKVFSLVSVLASFAIIAVPISDIISRCENVIKQSANFMLSFIPVFASAVAMSGKPSTAGVYGSFMFAAVEMLSQVTAVLLLPLITVYLALSITGAVSDTVDLSGFAETIKKLINWALGIILTIFVGIMSLQGIVAGSADTIGVRTAKYIIGSSLPVVGGAISDAFNSLYACLGLLKSTVGVFGIIAVAAIYLPTIMQAGLMILSLNLASAIGGILGDKTVSSLAKSASSAVSILLGIILISMSFAIVATTAILAVTSGG